MIASKKCTFALNSIHKYGKASQAIRRAGSVRPNPRMSDVYARFSVSKSMKELNGGEYAETMLQEKDSETFDGKLEAMKNKYSIEKINQVLKLKNKAQVGSELSDV